MSHPKVAALDLGDARVGVAVSDELGMFAHPRPALDARNPKALLEALKELARDEELAGFVVGLPLDMNGGHGVRAKMVEEQAARIAEATALPVELLDERLTTVEAARHMKASGARVRERASNRRGARDTERVGRIDTASAMVILQAWLDARAR